MTKVDFIDFTNLNQEQRVTLPHRERPCLFG